MKNKEKELLKRHLSIFAIIIGLYVVVQALCSGLMGKEFKDYLFTWEWQEEHNAMDLDQIEITFAPEGIVRLDGLTKEDGWIVYHLYPEASGSTGMMVIDKESGEEVHFTSFHVTATGTITDLGTGNFTNYRIYHLNIVVLCIALMLALWGSFVHTQKRLRYSYQSIFYSGLALWMTLVALVQLWVWFTEDVMANAYGVLQVAAGQFMLITSPLILIFCVALSVSNISLIRHEGFRTNNALGIILSIILLLGAVVYYLALGIYQYGSDLQFRIFLAVTGVYSSVYAFMECFLIGAIICGTLAARQEPDYDRDYLIILGCMIKADGTLYPLIRGRVDKAIDFYYKQLEKTGKKAVFIPSGGKGSDEPMAEATAMKRYLLEQGIPEEQIIAEDQSINTVQNMRFSKKLIEERTPNAKTAFSTTNFHVFRSGIIARQNDFEPQGMGSPTKWYFWPNAYMREVVGMMVYKWKSIVLALIPVVAFLIVIQFVG